MYNFDYLHRFACCSCFLQVLNDASERPASELGAMLIIHGEVDADTTDMRAHIQREQKRAQDVDHHTFSAGCKTRRLLLDEYGMVGVPKGMFS